ncbi:MAG: hypothetical protein PHD74_09805, partial [Candidatus Krumholzibacteria bacterium]|nr:hypothetical protein [Candidatus Krumholzibacteria bacterium]
YNRSATQIDPATNTISVQPTVSYRFSNNVTGGMSMSYQRSSGGRLGRVYNTVTMSMTAEFKF